MSIDNMKQSSDMDNPDKVPDWLRELRGDTLLSDKPADQLKQKSEENVAESAIARRDFRVAVGGIIGFFLGGFIWVFFWPSVGAICHGGIGVAVGVISGSIIGSLCKPSRWSVFLAVLVGGTGGILGAMFGAMEGFTYRPIYGDVIGHPLVLAIRNVTIIVINAAVLGLVVSQIEKGTLSKKKIQSSTEIDGVVKVHSPSRLLVPQGIWRVLVLILSFTSVVIGLILGLLYFRQSDEKSRLFGQDMVIAAVLGLVFTVLLWLALPVIL